MESCQEITFQLLADKTATLVARYHKSQRQKGYLRWWVSDEALRLNQIKEITDFLAGLQALIARCIAKECLTEPFKVLALKGAYLKILNDISLTYGKHRQAFTNSDLVKILLFDLGLASLPEPAEQEAAILAYQEVKKVIEADIQPLPHI